MKELNFHTNINLDEPMLETGERDKTKSNFCEICLALIKTENHVNVKLIPTTKKTKKISSIYENTSCSYKKPFEYCQQNLGKVM